MSAPDEMVILPPDERTTGAMAVVLLSSTAMSNVAIANDDTHIIAHHSLVGWVKLTVERVQQ